MKSWQEKALRKGRTPLPDSAGSRPWLDVPADEQAKKSNETPASDAAPASSCSNDATASAAATTAVPDESAVPEGNAAASTAEEGNSASYTFWRGDELRRLIQMRNGGAKWAAIAEAFPERTLEALKQTYHKRRHATERLMEEENAAAEENAEATAPGDEKQG